MKNKTKALLSTILFCLIIVSLIIVGLIIISFLNKKDVTKIETIEQIQIVQVDVPTYTKHLIRYEINEIVIDERLKKIYRSITKDKEIADAIIQKSLQLKVPINLAFALACVESRYDSKAINKNSHSTDKGLFQLNTRSFPNVDYFDIEENTKYALSYLKELYVKNESWETAILFYNAGSIEI